MSIMNKIKCHMMLVVIAVMALLLCACVANHNASFNGSKTGDEDHFEIDFEMLNATYTHELVMKEGESIEVSIEKESGEISVLIQQDSHDPVYKGDDVQDGDFNVVISEAGAYTLSVTGEKAKGHVVFTRQESTEDNDDKKGTDEIKEAEMLIGTEESGIHISTDQIAGPWHLDESALDIDLVNEKFPGAMEFGNGMEIKSDGKLSWYIGADGGTGTYTIEGDVINASFTGDMDGLSYSLKLQVQVEDTITSLVMEYKNFTFIWNYGEGETSEGND